MLSPFITLLGYPNRKSWFIWISLFCRVCWFIRLGIWLWVDAYWSPMDPYWSMLKIKMLCISQFCMNSLKGFCIFTILYILVRVDHYCWWIWTFALAMACDIFDKERISTKLIREMYIITSLLIQYAWSNWPVGSLDRINMHHDWIVNTIDLAELTVRVSWLTIEPSRRTLVLKGVHVMSGITQKYVFFTQKHKN